MPYTPTPDSQPAEGDATSDTTTWHKPSVDVGRPTRDDPPPGTVRTVTGCADCPFRHDTQDVYNEGDGYVDVCDVERCALANQTIIGEEPPDWCPLREGDITVRLER